MILMGVDCSGLAWPFLAVQIDLHSSVPAALRLTADLSA